MNDQRKVIFEDRRRMMASESLESTIEDMRTGVIDDVVAKHIPHDAYPEAWDIAGLKSEVLNKLGLDLPVDEWAKEEGIADEEVAARLHKAAEDAYAQRVQRNTPDVMRYIEKQVILQSLDHLWREHLVTLDHLRQVIGWRGMAQRDPLNEYKSEAFELFRELITQWHEGVIGQISRVEVRFQQPEPEPPPMQYQHIDPATGENEYAFAPSPASAEVRSFDGAVGTSPWPIATRKTRRHGAGSAEMNNAPADPARSSNTATARWLDARASLLRLRPLAPKRWRASQKRSRSAGIEDPAREARIEPLRRLGRLACRADRRPAGAARVCGCEGSRSSRSRRAAGEPLSRIVGRREFWGLSLAITPHVLDPRPETETIVEAALSILSDRRDEPLRILDLGVGSGALLCALLTEFGAARGVGVDISADAANVAQAQSRGVRPLCAGRDSRWRLDEWPRRAV